MYADTTASEVQQASRWSGVRPANLLLLLLLRLHCPEFAKLGRLALTAAAAPATCRCPLLSWRIAANEYTCEQIRVRAEQVRQQNKQHAEQRREMALQLGTLFCHDIKGATQGSLHEQCHQWRVQGVLIWFDCVHVTSSTATFFTGQPAGTRQVDAMQRVRLTA
jgi:hypothetical protein